RARLVVPGQSRAAQLSGAAGARDRYRPDHRLGDACPGLGRRALGIDARLGKKPQEAGPGLGRVRRGNRDRAPSEAQPVREAGAGREGRALSRVRSAGGAKLLGRKGERRVPARLPPAWGADPGNRDPGNPHRHAARHSRRLRGGGRGRDAFRKGRPVTPRESLEIDADETAGTCRFTGGIGGGGTVPSGGAGASRTAFARTKHSFEGVETMKRLVGILAMLALV